MKSTNEMKNNISPLNIAPLRYAVMELPAQSNTGTPYQYVHAATAALTAYAEECQNFGIDPLTGIVCNTPLSVSPAVVYMKRQDLPAMRVKKFLTFARAVGVVRAKLEAAGNSGAELFRVPFVSTDLSADNAERILTLAEAIATAWNIRPERFARPQAV